MLGTSLESNMFSLEPPRVYHLPNIKKDGWSTTLCWAEPIYQLYIIISHIILTIIYIYMYMCVCLSNFNPYKMVDSSNHHPNNWYDIGHISQWIPICLLLSGLLPTSQIQEGVKWVNKKVKYGQIGNFPPCYCLPIESIEQPSLWLVNKIYIIPFLTRHPSFVHYPMGDCVPNHHSHPRIEQGRTRRLQKPGLTLGLVLPDLLRSYQPAI
jgi:hypothetical protein